MHDHASAMQVSCTRPLYAVFSEQEILGGRVGSYNHPKVVGWGANSQRLGPFSFDWRLVRFSSSRSFEKSATTWGRRIDCGGAPQRGEAVGARPRVANCRAAFNSSRVSPRWRSIIFSIAWPSTRSRKTSASGTPLSRNTKARPPLCPGTVATAEHFDQSNFADPLSQANAALSGLGG
jgi:hypothetical protein